MIPLLTCLAFVLSVPDMSPIEDAIWAVESNRCESNCPNGDNNKARGALQIHRICFDTVKRDGETYEMVDSLEFSLEIFRRTMDRFVTKKRLKRKPKLKDMAQCWNGGGSWFKSSKKKQDNLARYWAKVKKELDKNGS